MAQNHNTGVFSLELEDVSWEITKQSFSGPNVFFWTKGCVRPTCFLDNFFIIASKQIQPRVSYPPPQFVFWAWYLLFHFQTIGILQFFFWIFRDACERGLPETQSVKLLYWWLWLGSWWRIQHIRVIYKHLSH